MGSFATSKALSAVFVLLFITFTLLDLGHFTSPTWNVVGGYFGLATAVTAWYSSAAGLLNTVHGRSILPVGRKKKVAV